MSTLHTKQFSVMMVEDQPPDLRAFRRLLDTKSIKTNVMGIRTANSAIDALMDLNYADARPDLVVLDLNLPDDNGLNLLVSLKTDPDLRHIPVIVFTVSNHTDDILKAWRYRAQSYLIKPNKLENWQRITDILADYWANDALHRLPFFF